MKSNLAEKRDYVSSTNACKACMSLGACIAFKGIEGCVPFLHGSQGCATYMRRYLISHFREPVDIASSSLGENDAVFGGGPNLKQGLVNMINKYQAKAVGIATTCLTETIGDNVPAIVKEFMKEARVEGGGRQDARPDPGIHPLLRRHSHGRLPRGGAGHGGPTGRAGGPPRRG